MVSVAGVEDTLAHDDADLVARIASGDTGEPVAELYRRFGTRLYRFGFQQLGDAGLAEEMVQECFVRLWRTAGRFDLSRGSVAAYMFVMARSIAADLRRRPSSRPLAPVEEEHVPPQPDSTDQIEGTAGRAPPLGPGLGRLASGLAVRRGLGRPDVAGVGHLLISGQGAVHIFFHAGQVSD